MKILSVSDCVEHALNDRFDAARFSGIDLILSCGDLPPEYLEHLNAVLNVPLFYVLGNHDIRFVQKRPAGCVNIHARIVRHGGLNIMGLEGSRWYNGGPFQYTEARMRKTIRGLWLELWRKGGVDIVITHAPPRHVHDAEDQCHRGFTCFRKFIDKYSPGFFVHGHIHVRFSDASQRATVINQTRVINTCGYHIFETENAEADR